MADQGEFLEIGGKKVYKSLFKNEDDWNKLVESQTGTPEMREEKQKREQGQERQFAEEQAAEKQAELDRLAKIGITYKDQPKEGETPKAPALTADEQAAKQEEAITASATPAAPATQPPAAPVVQTVTPAMIQETAITTVSQSPEAKKAVKMYEDATKASIVANEQKAQFDIQRANTMAAAKEREAQQMELDMAETKKRNDEQRDALKLQQDKMATTANELANYQFKNFFEGRDGARAMAGLSIALGAVGQAFAGGPNLAMDIIQSSIQNDLALQRANYDKLKGTFEGQRTLYGQLVDRFKDENLAAQTMTKIRYDQMAKQAEAASAKISDPEAKARIAVMTAQLKQEGAKAMMAATEGLKTSVQTQIKQAAKQAPGDIIKARADFEDRVKKSPVGDAISTQNAAEKFRAIVKAGAGEEAVAEFIAGKGGLGQGSYSPAFTATLNNMGITDLSMESVRKFFKGGVNPATLNKIQNFLDAASMQSAQDSVRHIPYIAQEAQLVGIDPEVYVSQINQKGLRRSKIEQSGARRISP